MIGEIVSISTTLSIFIIFPRPTPKTTHQFLPAAASELLMNMKDLEKCLTVTCQRS